MRTNMNPCKRCTHGWHCIDADRELACNQFEDAEGGKKNGTDRRARNGSGSGDTAGQMDKGN